MRGIVWVVAFALPAVASASVRLPPGQAEADQAASLIVEGQYQRAEPLLRQAARLTPEDPYVHFNLASVLRATGRYDAAVAEYRQAQQLFLRFGGGNGEGDVSNCLYGIALAEEAKGVPARAEQAWAAYLDHARRYRREQPSVQIAESHRSRDAQLAGGRVPVPGGPQRAARPSVTR